jgi:hypothetical protein
VRLTFNSMGEAPMDLAIFLSATVLSIAGLWEASR